MTRKATSRPSGGSRSWVDQSDQPWLVTTAPRRLGAPGSNSTEVFSQHSGESRDHQPRLVVLVHGLRPDTRRPARSRRRFRPAGRGRCRPGSHNACPARNRSPPWSRTGGHRARAAIAAARSARSAAGRGPAREAFVEPRLGGHCRALLCVVRLRPSRGQLACRVARHRGEHRWPRPRRYHRPRRRSPLAALVAVDAADGNDRQGRAAPGPWRGRPAPSAAPRRAWSRWRRSARRRDSRPAGRIDAASWPAR